MHISSCWEYHSAALPPSLTAGGRYAVWCLVCEASIPLRRCRSISAGVIAASQSHGERREDADHCCAGHAPQGPREPLRSPSWLVRCCSAEAHAMSGRWQSRISAVWFRG